jgi:hypothetical protein
MQLAPQLHAGRHRVRSSRGPRVRWSHRSSLTDLHTVTMMALLMALLGVAGHFTALAVQPFTHGWDTPKVTLWSTAVSLQ